MNSIEFFNELLNRIEALQTEVNKIRDIIKTRIQDAKAHA